MASGGGADAGVVPKPGGIPPARSVPGEERMADHAEKHCAMNSVRKCASAWPIWSLSLAMTTTSRST